MNLIQTVDNREKGEVPVSIGTALALAGLIGKHPDRPEEKTPPIEGVQLLMVNIRTLFRNLLGAVDRTEKPYLKEQHIVPALIEEISVISAFVTEFTNGRTQALFYVGQYKHLTDERFKGASLKVPTTAAQLAYSQLEQAAVELLKRKELHGNVIEFSGPISGNYPKTAILTHMPVDLLEKNKFQKLELLESHTGALKPPAMWGSKLAGQNTQALPFNVFTLKVFGDGVSISGKRPSVKRAIMDVAMSDRWNGLSTMALIENSVKKIKDSEIKNELLMLL